MDERPVIAGGKVKVNSRSSINKSQESFVSAYTSEIATHQVSEDESQQNKIRQIQNQQTEKEMRSENRKSPSPDRLLEYPSYGYSL